MSNEVKKLMRESNVSDIELRVYFTCDKEMVICIRVDNKITVRRILKIATFFLTDILVTLIRKCLTCDFNCLLNLMYLVQILFNIMILIRSTGKDINGKSKRRKKVIIVYYATPIGGVDYEMISERELRSHLKNVVTDLLISTKYIVLRDYGHSLKDKKYEKTFYYI